MLAQRNAAPHVLAVARLFGKDAFFLPAKIHPRDISLLTSKTVSETVRYQVGKFIAFFASSSFLFATEQLKEQE